MSTYTAHCTLHTVHHIVYTTYCTLYSRSSYVGDMVEEWIWDRGCGRYSRYVADTVLRSTDDTETV